MSLLQAILSDKSLQSFASVPATSNESLRSTFHRALGTEVVDAGKSGTYASLHHVMALATVLKKRIRLVYPDRNAALRPFLNTSVDPVVTSTSQVTRPGLDIPPDISNKTSQVTCSTRSSSCLLGSPEDP